MPKPKKRKSKDSELSTKARKTLKNRLWFYIKTPDYTPITQKQLFKNLKIEKSHQVLAASILTEFIQKGMICIEKNKLKLRQNEVETIEGTFFRHPKGFGFVTPQGESLQDIFIPKAHTLSALNQDRVKVKLISHNNKMKGPEGIITEIVLRGRNTLVGIINDNDKKHFVAFCPSLGESKIVGVVPEAKINLKVGDRVLLEIIDWDGYPFEILTKPIKILGHISDPKTDLIAAIYDYKLNDSFPKELLNQVKLLPEIPQNKDLENRIDLTSIETFTIDPDSAKDFDDALSLTEENNHYNLIVHIADVAHYVKENSLIDIEAKKRCNSVYFPSKCLPMLPEKLSNGLCSLKENVIRLSVSVFMCFDQKGTLISYDIKKSFIKSQKRFTYNQVKQILDKKLDSPHESTLRLMKQLCLLLQKKRKERGSIDFAMEEISLRLDENEDPIGYDIIDYDISHQIVEEFMLKANEVVATHLTDKNIQMLYRIHEHPKEVDIQNFYDLARALGFKITQKANKNDLQELFDKAKNTPHLHQLCLAFIKSMKLAIYSENNVGHYGLSLDHYCHFTSPIRRYSDLIIHRLLFEEPIDATLLKELGKKLSEQERISFRAEMFVITQKKVRLLNKYYLETPNKKFEAYITKIKPYGIYFEVSPIQFEGFVHISELGYEYFHYLDKSALLVGEQTNKKYKAGKKIKIAINHLNLITGEVHFRLLDQ